MLGIQIRVSESGTAKNSDVKFSLFAGAKERGILFITTPAIRKWMEESRIGTGQRIGHIELSINHTARIASFTRYYPTINIYHQLGKKKQQPPKIGLATLAELQIEKWIARHYRDYMVISSPDASPERQTQLSNRGRNPTAQIGIREAIALTRKYVIASYAKNGHANSIHTRGRALKHVHNRMK